MPTPAEINAAGPWAVLVFVLIGGIVALFGAFVKQLIVPGWIYRSLRDDWQKLKDQGDRNAKAIEAMAERERKRARDA